MRKLIIVLALLIGLLSITGCTSEQVKDNVGGIKQSQTKQTFVVYRAAADGSENLLPEKFTIEGNGKSAMLNALETLVGTKPGDAKYSDVVPIGTKVLGLKVQDGTAYADFSKEIAKKGQGSYEEMMLCYAITNTLTEFSEVKRVQILVEGKKVTSFNGHMDLEDPLKRNTSLIPAKN